MHPSPTTRAWNGVERRAYKRAPVELEGRYMLDSGHEFPCKVTELSPGGVKLRARALGRIGERVISYAEKIGRIEGRLVRFAPGGFILEIAASTRQKERLSLQTAWLDRRLEMEIQERRHAPRITPHERNAIVYFHARQHQVEIVNLSSTGACFVSPQSFEPDQKIVIGARGARIVWSNSAGTGAEFETPIPDFRFDQFVVL